MVYGFVAFNSVFKYHRASLYGDKVIVLDIMLFTSQRLLSFIQVYVARPVRKITYVLLVFVVRPLSVDASLSPDY